MDQNDKGLKIIIITIGKSQIVMPMIESRHKVVGIIESGVNNKGEKTSIKKFFVQNTKRVYKRVFGLERLAKMYKIPYYYMDNGCDFQLENWVKKLEPDLIIVYGMTQLLKENIYNIPKYKTINLHPSILPFYRGHSPEFWMYYDTELNPGVTLHYIDQGEDTGDIIYQEKYKIPLGTKFPEMEKVAIGQIGVKLIKKACDEFELGTIPRSVQPHIESAYRARKIKQEEHKSLINWEEWPIEKIWHLLRGTEQWLEAIEQPTGLFKGYRWEIMHFEKCTMDQYETSKVYADAFGRFIACKDGKIYLSKNFSFELLFRSMLT
ncbi:methionyl-tRNA formyltransferase [Bacillus massiliigorillae]|uniref:methionyl-tRNA formyltransferase n=1 Tax=Bacillus massiliigorillae TaxID=1243664 RepID=UPI00039CAA89|nr:formyltransferase family protein [Bacillus massiliigorillae]